MDFDDYSTLCKSLWLLNRQISICSSWLDGVECSEVKPSDESVQDCKEYYTLASCIVPSLEKILEKYKKDLKIGF